ncbi:MAG TPA: sodium:calcium antiporter [Candidatus Polarisedimenticolia bacterium]|nr:sodium:calcium antiporter [Candidatus Polarisedimenticolia bacterium]
MPQLYLALAVLLTLPGLFLRATGSHAAPTAEAVIFGVAILGAAFLLSWAAEVAQKDISQGLAVAILALIAVLPEYAVDMVFAWNAAKDPSYSHYALANMTGANRLLVGVGWPAVVILFALRFKKISVKLEAAHRVEIFFMGLATVYAIVLPLKGTLGLIDAFFFLAIFAFYAAKIMKAEVHEPELIGPAAWLGKMSPVPRRISATGLLAFCGTVIFLSAEPFAHSLVEAGKGWGIDEFLLVQWLAPLASEAPEFIIALIWTFRGDAPAGLGALVSSKVNQWTLLVGTLPIVYSISLGGIGALHLDIVQEHELWLTAAQSLLAVAILANLSLSWYGALVLFVLFAAQLVFDHIRMQVSVIYVVLAVMLMVRDRKSYPPLFKRALRG